MDNVITALVGYLLGCFQTSFIISKLFKKQDIRELGNGNAGASNTTVVYGMKYGILVAIVDILKAAISITLIRSIFRDNTNLNFLIYINCLFVILGHNYPFYMKFKGGKGTASLIGGLLAIDYRIAIIGVIAIVFVSLLTNYIALGTLALVTSFTVTTYIYGYEAECLVIAMAIAVMSIFKHTVNFRNILNGTEHKVRKFF